jgi:hypothetical protein
MPVIRQQKGVLFTAIPVIRTTSPGTVRQPKLLPARNLGLQWSQGLRCI